MGDEMFLSDDLGSLKKGKRGMKRTPVTRGVEFWLISEPEIVYNGLVIDINIGGVGIISKHWLPCDSEIEVDVKRDQSGASSTLFRGKGKILWVTEKRDAFQFGVRLAPKEKPEEKKRSVQHLRHATPDSAASSKKSRMHALDVIIGKGRNR
ncbi:PilZ domain-containing protein [Candidatus Hydrogenedentota bacterium]